VKDRLEYFDGGREDTRFTCTRSGSRRCVRAAPGGQPNTSVTTGQHRSSDLKYRFRIALGRLLGHDEATSYDEGLFDIRVVPGMTVPTDLKAQFSLHTKNVIDSVVAEFRLRRR
jgi:hypothetical protein